MARRYTRGRPVNGIFLLDKPSGLTSNAALQEVKRLLNARKAGHTGNLDPLATGLLPVCLGEATKMSAFLLDADKRYQGVCKLGERTNTGDAEGEVTERMPVPALTEARVREVLQRFVGLIEQIPPMHSAIKRQGQPLYKLAHQGIVVEREARSVCIHGLELLRLEGNELEIDVHCSKGTYVRTLAEDIAAALGTVAHLSSLRRTLVGPFDIAHSVTLDELADLVEEGGPEAADARLLPLETAISNWPAVQLTENTSHYMRQGQPVLIPRAPTQGWVRLFGPTQGFIGVGQILDDGRVAPKRLVSVA